jgi:hypothetical protein
MTKEELQLVSVEDLTEELENRFDAIVIYGLQKDPKNNNKSVYFDSWRGDHATLLGLCDILKEKIFSDWSAGEAG